MMVPNGCVDKKKTDGERNIHHRILFTFYLYDIQFIVDRPTLHWYLLCFLCSKCMCDQWMNGFRVTNLISVVQLIFAKLIPEDILLTDFIVREKNIFVGLIETLINDT